MGPLIHRQSAVCLTRHCYRPSSVVRLQRAFSRRSRALRPLQALGGSRGSRRPESESAFVEQFLPVQEVEVEEEEEYSEDSDDYYTGSRSSKPAAAPEVATAPVGEAGQEAAEDADVDEEKEVAGVAGEAEAEAEAKPEDDPEVPPVEEVVVDVVVATPSEYIEVEVEEEYQQVSLQDYIASGIRFLHSENLGRGISFGVAAVLGATLGLAIFRTWSKYTSSRAKRRRLVDKNKLLVEELDKYLPDNQAKLNSSVVRALKAKTGFTEVEIFRKFLWYALRERKFDQALIDNFSYLKTALQLSDNDVAEALRERAQRVYDKYGTLMLNTSGMTAEGIERKATCKALFQKILYITECEAVLPAGSPAADSVNLREIFGATEEDLQEARIVSLYDVDLERLDALASAATDDVTAEEAEKTEIKEEPPVAATPSAPEVATPTTPAAESTPAPVSQPEFVFRDVEVEPLPPTPAAPSSTSNQPAAPAASSKAETAVPASTDSSPASTDSKAAASDSSSSGGSEPPPGSPAGSASKSS